MPVPADSVSSTLSGFGVGDTIDLVKIQDNGFELVGSSTLLSVEGSNVVGSLTLAGDYASSNFTLASDGKGGTDILFVAGADAGVRLSAQDFGWGRGMGSVGIFVCEG